MLQMRLPIAGELNGQQISTLGRLSAPLHSYILIPTPKSTPADASQERSRKIFTLG